MIEAKTVGRLIEELAQFPADMEVEVEVHDLATGARLWGPLWIAREEGGIVNLFARHDTSVS